MLKQSAEYELVNEGPYSRISFRIRAIDFKRYFADFEDADVLQVKEAEKLIHIAEADVGQSIVSDFLLEKNRLVVKVAETGSTEDFVSSVLRQLQSLYEENETHITRMFGSFVYLKRVDGELRAVHATPIPIQYCPLMAKLLTEIGGETATQLLSKVAQGAPDSAELMCQLINEVVIQGGYFDTSRPLNSCEVNVLFGASETISSGFAAELIDAAVIVSNNLGTIITTNPKNTQGAVKRMTGLFSTSPSKDLMKTAAEAGILPVFPHTASIDQLEGVKQAISLGYTRIAVSVAWQDNEILDAIEKLQSEEVTIYKLALCSTGLHDDAAKAMMQYADLVWSCSSKAVKEYIEPNAAAQVGIKIPVYILTEKGWKLVKNHVYKLAKRRDESMNLESVRLVKGPQRPVVYNATDHFAVERNDSLQPCTDCPYPCI